MSGPSASDRGGSAADHTDREPSAEQIEAWLDEGIALFEAGEYWHAHEAWEQAWHTCREPERDLYQGLILLTAAIFKLEQEGARPQSMLRLLRKSEVRLRDYVPRHMGLDVEAILTANAELQVEARRHLDDEDGWQGRASRRAIPTLERA